MTIDRFNPPELARPSGFSHAVAARGGTVVFLAGQTGSDETGAIIGVGLVVQFERALANLLTALAAAGGGPGHLASLTIYATNLADYRAHGPELGAVWRRLAGRDYPAMAAVGVASLWDPRAVVEISGFAVIP